jgi:hypothetical protein
VEIAASEAKLIKARQINKQGMLQELLIGRIRLINGDRYDEQPDF